MAHNGREHGNTWISDLANLLYDTPAEALPAEVRHVAGRQTLDSVACALGALHHDAAVATRRVVRSVPGPRESTLICEGTRDSAHNAILYNGTLIRALDFNDAFLRSGLGGHPSDNIAVALAFAERQRASGLEYLRTVALGYELFWRVRQHLSGRTGAKGYSWDGLSVSGLVGAAMAGLLLGLDRRRLAHALAIGGAQTFSLSEIRRGDISMLKASANAVAAHTGALGALLADAGISVPSQYFEGERGLPAALGFRPTDESRQALLGPMEYWHILDISIKPFPAIATSQGAIAATLELVHRDGVRAADLERVEVHFADLPITREHLADEARSNPRTRETADHSIPFLVAAALEDGELGSAQFRDERWLRPSARELMGRIRVMADPELNAHAKNEYPAVVVVATRDGQTLRREMLQVPGSPGNPRSDQALGDKLRRFGAWALSGERLATIEERRLHLEGVADMAEVGELLRGE